MGYRNSQTIAAFSPFLNKQPQLMPAHMHTQTRTETLWWAMRFMSEAECGINTLSKTELYSLKLDTSSVKKVCICRSIGREKREKTPGGRRIKWTAEVWSDPTVFWYGLDFTLGMQQNNSYKLTPWHWEDSQSQC